MTGTVRTALLLACLAWAVPGPAGAQEETAEAPGTRQEILERRREEKRERLEPYVVSTAERRIRFLETWRLPRRLFAKGVGGFRPVIGGMPSGSGFVVGGGYIAGYNHDLLQFTANARVSTRGFTTYDAGLLIFPRANSDRPVEGYLTVGDRDLDALRFFGLGPGSLVEDRTTYRLEDSTFEAGVTVWAGRFAELGASAEWLSALATVGPGSPYDPTNVPALGSRERFFVTGGRAALHFLEESVEPAVGVSLGVEGYRYDDRSSDLFDFTRVVGEVKGYVPLGYRNRILALRLRSSSSTAGDGGQVPFYLMETLGGANTIRGFKEYRFRDVRNLLVSAEYRWEVWTYADLAFFYDGGKVFSDADDFDFSGLESGYGFGLRGHGPGGMVLRFDFSRSNEGFVLHIGSGPDF